MTYLPPHPRTGFAVVDVDGILTLVAVHGISADDHSISVLCSDDDGQDGFERPYIVDADRILGMYPTRVVARANLVDLRDTGLSDLAFASKEA